MAAAPSTTPMDLGLSPEDLWVHITPYYGFLAVLGEDNFSDAFVCEAVFIASGVEGLTVCVPTAASPDLPAIPLETSSEATEAGTAAAGQSACCYLHLPHGSYRVLTPGESLPSTACTFLQCGGTPSMPAVALNVPLDLLPDVIAGSIMEVAEFREEAPDLDGAPLTASDLPPATLSPLFGGVEVPGPSGFGLLLGGGPPAGPPLGLPVGGLRPPPAAGRGRAAAWPGSPSAVPPTPPPSLASGAAAGAGRGKAAPRSSAARPTLAGVAAMVSEGFTTRLQEGQEH